jgi:MFS family permease
VQVPREGTGPRRPTFPTAPVRCAAAPSEPGEAERLSPAPPVADSGARRLLGLATIDVGPLRRHRDFRLLFAGQAATFFGSLLTYVAIPFQAFRLSGSSLVVGLLGVAELVPLLATAFAGGALANAIDRRRLVLLTELGLAGATVVLLANALVPHPSLAVLFVVAALMAGLDGLQRPSLSALTPRLVGRDELPAAAALESLRGTIGMVLGPVVAGLLIAAAGLPSTYAVDLATFGESLLFLRAMRAVPPPPDADAPSLRGIREGIRDALGREVLVGTYAVDFVAMLFGMPLALFPALAEKLGGPGVLGLLYASPSAGAALATLTSGWTARVHRHGLAVLAAATGWGAGILVCGLANGVAVACVGLVAAGFADMLSGLFRTTIWNQTIPDRLRGRLAGIEQVSYSTGPLLGNLEAGVVAALTSVRTSIVSGGLLCLVAVPVAGLLLPGFRRYDARGQVAR